MYSLKMNERELVILGAGLLAGFGLAALVGYYYQRGEFNKKAAHQADTYAAALGYTPAHAASKSVTPSEEAQG